MERVGLTPPMFPKNQSVRRLGGKDAPRLEGASHFHQITVHIRQVLNEVKRSDSVESLRQKGQLVTGTHDVASIGPEIVKTGVSHCLWININPHHATGNVSQMGGAVANATSRIKKAFVRTRVSRVHVSGEMFVEQVRVDFSGD
jgi:hypothetical protein